jgi:hypothetical protein
MDDCAVPGCQPWTLPLPLPYPYRYGQWNGRCSTWWYCIDVYPQVPESERQSPRPWTHSQGQCQTRLFVNALLWQRKPPFLTSHHTVIHEDKDIEPITSEKLSRLVSRSVAWAPSRGCGCHWVARLSPLMSAKDKKGRTIILGWVWYMTFVFGRRSCAK